MEIYLLGGFAFLAGFIDSMAGGGGLIQLPALMAFQPQLPMVNLLALNKSASICGTVTSSSNYLRKIRLDWPADHDGLPLPTGMPKLILNLVMLATECLPRGGVIGVSLAAGDGRAEARVTAAGQGGRLPPEFQLALSPDAPVDELTAKTVQAHFVARLTQALGGTLDLPTGAPDSVVMAVSLPAA